MFTAVPYSGRNQSTDFCAFTKPMFTDENFVEKQWAPLETLSSLPQKQETPWQIPNSGIAKFVQTIDCYNHQSCVVSKLSLIVSKAIVA